MKEDLDHIEEPDQSVADNPFIETYIFSANESGRLKKIWTWFCIVSFLIGTSVSIINFFRK
ncbi:hypothetical protein Desaci_3872 [Desulfosporosinus acidiphilus SJ4]|uniref:Uncharacterized protein n=1 Tax=Desulfosporosinus acidiphilus (strain DSM 22704 / JCM 16185 / SJ4) TaxID=646529 RepID=I4DAC8_DESAJ|nr:hypothetical protein [Desulfosporosinus acidiphilus]AFM42752.1 hypothetical protein Desaci_3872 [Desulfosporosinus acidiphilus SJ4]